MAELSDDSLSDDDALKRGEDNDGPFGGLVFHWASDIGGWGNKALGDDDRASLPELAFLETHLSNLDMNVVDAILKRCPKLKYARI